MITWQTYSTLDWNMYVNNVVGIPLYIYTTASTPIAAALILKGVKWGS